MVRVEIRVGWFASSRTTPPTYHTRICSLGSVEDDKSDSDSPSDEKPVFNRKASLRKSLKPLADMLKADKPKVLITRMIDLTKSP